MSTNPPGFVCQPGPDATVGNTDQRSKQVEGVEISSYVALLIARCTSESIARGSCRKNPHITSRLRDTIQCGAMICLLQCSPQTAASTFAVSQSETLFPANLRSAAASFPLHSDRPPRSGRLGWESDDTGSGSHACLSGHIVQARVRPKRVKGLLRHLQNAARVPLSVCTRFSAARV